MPKSSIQVIDPNRFVQEFIDPSASPLIEKVHQTTGLPLTKSNFFAIMRIEGYVQHIRFPIPVARNVQYDFFLITKGYLLATDGLQSYRVGQHELLIRAAGTIGGVDECSPDAEGFYGLFDADYVLYNLKNQNSLNELPFFGPYALPVISLSTDESIDFQRQLTKIETQQLRQRPTQQAYMSASLYSFLLDAASIHGELPPAGNAPSSATGLSARFKNLLKQHILSKRAVRDYADLLNVTPNHLNRCVKEATGKPASNWITDMLMLEAKVLLRQTDSPISEIAFQLSIEDVSYFARLFKKHTGLSPTEYRETSGTPKLPDHKTA